jgi:2,3,4,5-tetrahydropyridine-2-carboxylate N-succinyltransferase
MSRFEELIQNLEAGKIRVAEKVDGRWTVNTHIKKEILEGFKAGNLCDMSSDGFPFFDKDTLPLHKFSVSDKVRIVPGGSSVRCGAYVAPSVIIMPPSYVNIGAYIDEGTMVDSHVLVGSCAQIGKHVHLSAGTQIGGVLEPAGALPVIVEDNAFIGGNCGIYEGTIIREGAVLGSGVIVTSGTKVYDAISGGFLSKNSDGRVEIPAGAVVVAGSRPLSSGPGATAGIQIYTPVIIKYRDGKTDASLELEQALR